MNYLNISVRSKDKQLAINFMDELTRYIKEVGEIYPGITFKQMVRSPLSDEDKGFIDLEDCLKDFQKPPDKRTLKCPATRNFVDSEALLNHAGMLGVGNVTERENWWNFKPDFGWVTVRKVNEYSTLEFISHGQVKNHEYKHLLEMVLTPKQAFLMKKINFAYAVVNQTLLAGFEFCFKTMVGKANATNKLFKEEGWRNLADADRRLGFLNFFEEYAKQHKWNQSSQMNIIPMFQGTSEEAVWSIVENGFATVATLDAGYFGKGIYFSSDLTYSIKYANPQNPKGKVIIVALTIPGNAYPITEHPFLIDSHGEVLMKTDSEGKSMRLHNPDGFYEHGPQSGFQAHYTIVEKHNIRKAFPIKTSIDVTNHADELVVFQDAQTLPVFVLYVQD